MTEPAGLRTLRILDFTEVLDELGRPYAAVSGGEEHPCRPGDRRPAQAADLLDTGIVQSFMQTE
jgi:hypothetical protein